MLNRYKKWLLPEGLFLIGPYGLVSLLKRAHDAHYRKVCPPLGMNMPVKITTSKNYLGKGDKPFFVRTESSGRVEFEELVRIMAKGRTTITAPDIAGTLMLFQEELAKLVADGRYVKTPIGSFHATACGSFADEDQAFTPGQGDCKHGMRLHFRPAVDFEDDVNRLIQFVHVEHFDKHNPVIRNIGPVKSNTEPKPGDFVKVNGLRLQFDESDASQGVFFINGSEHRSADYAYLDNRTVVAQIPGDLEPGSYEVYLRSSRGLGNLRQAKADLALTVS